MFLIIQSMFKKLEIQLIKIKTVSNSFKCSTVMALPILSKRFTLLTNSKEQSSSSLIQLPSTIFHGESPIDVSRDPLPENETLSNA